MQKRLFARVAAIVTAAALGVSGAPPNVAQADQSITNAGPLTGITIGSTLNCDVRHRDDSSPEFYAGTACGTLIVVDGVLYGPTDIPAGGGASPRTPFTPVSQAITGDGSLRSPYNIKTEVAAGSSGVRLVQEDIYFQDDDELATGITIYNDTPVAKNVRVYRAGDCYLGNSDVGYGRIGPNWVACTSSNTGRAIQWVDSTGKAHRYESHYSNVWARIGQQEAFPDTADENVLQDNGAGLSWDLTVAARNIGWIAHDLRFGSDSAATDSDGDGFTDAEEIGGVKVGGETIDLRALGAKPDKKDIFLKIDYLKPNIISGINAFLKGESNLDLKPSQEDIKDLVHAYAIAPVQNPDGSQGINLHVSFKDDPMEYQYSLGADPDESLERARELRRTRLSAVEQKVYHYGLIVPWLGYTQNGLLLKPNTTSGIADLPGSTFVVARRAGLTYFLSGRSFRGTLMHEFGHNLGLHHGGARELPGSDVNCKPGYESVMNYTYQLSGRDGAVKGIDYYRGSDQTRHVDSRPACSSTPVASGDYKIYNDWSRLLYRPWMGGSALGSLVSSEVIHEPSAEDFEQANLLGADGSGIAVLASPAVLLRGDTAPQQMLWLNVRNMGNVRSAYSVEVRSEFLNSNQTIELEALQSGEIALTVPVEAVPPVGTYPMTIRLHSDTFGEDSESIQHVPVVQLSESEIAEVRSQLAAGDIPNSTPASRAGILTTLDHLLDANPPTIETPPTIDWSTPVPADGATYVFGDLPEAGPTCVATDSGSKASSQGCLVTGYSTAVGTHVVTATATDADGNRAVSNREYTVLAWRLDGFFAPIRGKAINVVQAGSAVPFKFTVKRGDKPVTDVGDLGLVVSQQSVNCNTDEPLGAPTTVSFAKKAGPRFDTTKGQFIFTWKVPKAAGSCVAVRATTADGSALAARFRIKKLPGMVAAPNSCLPGKFPKRRDPVWRCGPPLQKVRP